MFVVAGVTGKVGSVVARELLSQGKKVKVIVRDAAKRAAWSQKGAEVVVGNLTDVAFLAGALKGATGFFTLLPPDYSATDVFTAQKKMSDAIAAAVKQSGVPHVVMLSSVGADLPSGTGPVKGLHHLEEALRATGVKLTAVRAGMFAENVLNALGTARSVGVYPNFGTPVDMPVNMVATRDIGRLAARSLASPPATSEVVDILGPAYTARQLAEKLGGAVHKKVDIVNVPPEGWVEAMTRNGLPKPYAEALTEMYRAFGTGKIVPKGDRRVDGRTPIDEVIREALEG